jgi:hypothetical protein
MVEARCFVFMELPMVIQVRSILVALRKKVYSISKFLTSSSSRVVTEISGVSWKCKTNYHILKKPIRDQVLSYLNTV